MGAISKTGVDRRIPVKLGIDQFIEQGLSLTAGKKIGLVTNVSGVNGDGQSTIDLLFDHPEVDLRALYGPEHGIRGDIPGEVPVKSFTDSKTGLPVHSLYGPNLKPTADMLADVDVLVFDIQDVGSNVYTYIYTLAFVMEAAAEQNKAMIILDRPNPLSGARVEGPLRDPKYTRRMGRYLVPVRHGMTVGELAHMWNETLQLSADLHIVRMKHWQRQMAYRETGLRWVPPSPNMLYTETAYVYAGVVPLVDTNVSVGLGTARPFQLIGAPWVDGARLAHVMQHKTDCGGVRFVPISFIPETNRYAGQSVTGLQIIMEDPAQVDVITMGLTLLQSILRLYPDQFEFIQQEGQFPFDTNIGHPTVRAMLEEDLPVKDITAMWQKDLQRWDKNVRQRYLLY
jgi:uncharacterized protein YbbC (DUF1343 family)